VSGLPLHQRSAASAPDTFLGETEAEEEDEGDDGVLAFKRGTEEPETEAAVEEDETDADAPPAEAEER